VKAIVWSVLAVLAVIGAGVAVVALVSGPIGSPTTSTASLLGGPVPSESALVTYADLRAMLLTPTGSRQGPTLVSQASSAKCGLADSLLGAYDGALSEWTSVSSGRWVGDSGGHPTG
jgi:hypothetical protein